MRSTHPGRAAPVPATARPIAAIAVAVSIVPLLVAVAGCSSSDSPAPPSTSTSAPSSAASTSALDATTTPPLTTAPAQTSPGTSSGPAGSATSGATSLEVVQQQVLDAYLGMQNAFVSAATTADADAADLPKYATGDALKLLRSGLTSMQQKSLRGTGRTYFNPKVEQLAPAKNPTKARVRDCMDTRRATAVKTNDPGYKDPPGGWQLVIADLELTGSGQWKVFGVGVHEVGSCAG